jgi:small-conductance mechanosensitive channel
MDLDIIVLGNTLFEYGQAFLAFLIMVIVFRIFQFAVLKKLKTIAEKTKTDIDDTLISIVKSLKPHFYYLLSFYFAVYFINVSDLFKTILGNILLVFVVYQISIAFHILIDYILVKSMGKKNQEDLGVKAAMENVSKFAKFIVWVLGLLLILSNLGVNITSLVAGLGVGGVAIAFALKSILADLFSSFAIYFDKPFKVGDSIQIGADRGTVMKIGIMTTRLKTPQGEELVVSNQELISSRIQNFKKMEERRADFSFGITYETPIEKIKSIPNDVKQIIESIEGLRFGRAHFNRFDDSALNFDVVYYVDSNDYDKYADAQQEINLKIMEKFEEKGIEMAYPTQTVFVKNNS